jgi:L-rhamnonate dehydratase
MVEGGLRFGCDPLDGAAGMARNIELVRTVRETVGDEIDGMAVEVPG